MSLFSARWAYLLASTVVTWGAYYSWEKQKEGIVREQRLPVLQKALAAEIKDTSDASLCVSGGPFPAGDRLPQTAWVRQANGLSQCQVVMGGHSPNCLFCDQLVEAGLLTHDQESVQDANGNSFNTRVYRVTEAGRKVYYDDMRSREPAHDRSCTVGEVKYVSSDSAAQEDLHSGFCFGKELRLKSILEYQMPGKMGSSMMMSVRYQVEVVDPDPMLFDERLKPLLHTLPKPGNPALYDPVITTAVFAPDKQSIQGFDGGIRYGDWIGKN